MKISSHFLFGMIASFFLTFFGATGALAEENPAQKNWQINLAPFYLWGITLMET